MYTVHILRIHVLILYWIVNKMNSAADDIAAIKLNKIQNGMYQINSDWLL